MSPNQFDAMKTSITIRPNHSLAPVKPVRTRELRVWLRIKSEYGECLSRTPMEMYGDARRYLRTNPLSAYQTPLEVLAAMLLGK